MKNLSQQVFGIVALSLSLIFSNSNCQINIIPIPEVTPEDMVENLVGEGIMFSNVTFTGANISSGIFNNGQTTDLGFESGVFLTSGAGYIIPGPNNLTLGGTNNGTPGDPNLNAISTYPTYDAAILEFDFIVETDTLFIKYVFGSEEYNEYVGTLINDLCGCFITGPNPMGGQYANKNIAIVPGTTNTSITINNVNNGNWPPGVVPMGPCENCQYFDDNTDGLYLQYDGFTTVLYAWLFVVPGEQYHIKLGVADVGDQGGDSGVFLEENSLYTPSHLNLLSFGFEQLNNPSLTNNYEGDFNDDTINVVIPLGEYSDELIASFETEIGVMVFVNGVLQQSGVTPNNFDEPVIYMVAGYNLVNEYVVDVDVVNNENDILSFDFDPALNPGIEEYATGIIGEDAVDLYLPIGTDVSNLIATFTLPVQAKAYLFGQLQVSGVTPNNFTTSKLYTIEAGDGSLKDWIVIVHLITGLDEAAMNEVTIYPNPADDRLIIRNAAQTNLKIFSMLGVLFSETEIKSESHSEDMTLLPQGIYYLQIEGRKGTEVRKIIVSH
jgi:hypothetical protein